MVVVLTMLTTLVRGRLQLGLVTAGAMFVIVAMLLQDLAIGESQRAFVAIGLAIHVLVTDATAVAASFVLANTFLIGRAAIPWMARPRSRAFFVLTAILTLVVFTVMSSLALAVPLAAAASMYGASPTLLLLAACVGTGEALILGLIALALRLRFAGAFSIPTVCAVFLLGRLSGILAEMLERGTFGAMKPVLSVLRAIVPNLQIFDWTSVAMRGPADVSALVPFVYLLLYGSALTALAIVIHRRADFAKDEG